MPPLRTTAGQGLLAALLLAALGLACWGGLSLLLWSLMVPAGLNTLGWTPVSGQVVRAFTPGCGGRVSRMDLEYHYLWQGQVYSSTRLAAASDHHIWLPDCGAELARSLAPAFPEAATRAVTVYVNPRAPQEAVLVRGVPPVVRPLSCLLWAAGLGGAFLWLRRWPKR